MPRHDRRLVDHDSHLLSDLRRGHLALVRRRSEDAVGKMDFFVLHVDRAPGGDEYHGDCVGHCREDVDGDALRGESRGD